jgi:type IV pilus assembly protein PilB
MKIQKKKQIGKILIDKGLITPEQLQEALLQQQGTDVRIGQILIKKNVISENDLLGSLAIQYGVEFKNHLEFSDSNSVLKNVPSLF